MRIWAGRWLLWILTIKYAVLKNPIILKYAGLNIKYMFQSNLLLYKTNIYKRGNLNCVRVNDPVLHVPMNIFHKTRINVSIAPKFLY